MEALIWVLAVFTITCSAAFFFIWFRAKQLRDALKDQDGYRLMVIFTRIFLVTGIFLMLTSLRQILFVVNEGDTAVFRFGAALLGTLAIIGVHVWALMSVKALIDEGKEAAEHAHDEDEPPDAPLADLTV